VFTLAEAELIGGHITARRHPNPIAHQRLWRFVMSIDIEPSAETDTPIEVVTVVLDPRVAYAGFGPDDGPLAMVARQYDAEDVIEDLADAAEQLDFAYKLAWEKAAKRLAPDIIWNVSAPYHQQVEDFPLLDAIAKTGREDLGRTKLISQISDAITIEAQALPVGATRWAVFDGGRMVGSATVRHTVTSVEDNHTAETATLLRDGGEVLRSVDSGDLRLELIEPGGEARHDPAALGYVLTDRGTVIFAAADFRPSPMHAVDSDRTVEALAEFLALTPGDTDEAYFVSYTQRQSLWAAGDGPSKLYELITDLAGDTEYNAQIAADAEMAAEHSGEIRLWRVRPLDRDDLPPVDLLADSPSNARAQYPGYVTAWMADTGRDLDLDISPALGVEASGAPLRHGQPVLPTVRGQHTLDWGVDHVNHWGADAYLVTELVPTRLTLRIPATGTATLALINASGTAHAGAHVEAHHGSCLVALPDSDVRVYPGAAVNRRPGSYVTLAPEARMPQRYGAFRSSAMQDRARGR
jgi:hypothetical protein